MRAGASLPSLDLLSVDGKPQRVSTASELPVLINFWATNCASCLAEMKELARLHAEKKHHVIAVSHGGAIESSDVGVAARVEACVSELRRRDTWRRREL